MHLDSTLVYKIYNSDKLLHICLPIGHHTYFTHLKLCSHNNADSLFKVFLVRTFHFTLQIKNLTFFFRIQASDMNLKSTVLLTQ